MRPVHLCVSVCYLCLFCEEAVTSPEGVRLIGAGKLPGHSVDSVAILGVRVDSISLQRLIQEVKSVVTSGNHLCVMYANVHVLNTAWADPELRAILNGADVVYCDGAGVVLGAWLLGQRLPGRMTGADWIGPLCGACTEDGTTLYFLGGRPGVAARAADLLRVRHAGLRIVGTHHGYLLHPPPPELGEGGRGGEGTAAIAAVNGAHPHILLVGMGTPTQERWIAAHRQQLEVPVVWAVGALFDFVAGVQPRGPRWMLDHGLEWLCRLWNDPCRLWRRYVIGNPLFILRVLRACLKNACSDDFSR